MGIAVGGFGFSTTGGGVSVTAFPVQPVSRTVEQIVMKMPPHRLRGKKSFSTKGILANKSETVNALLLQPFAAVNHFGAAGQHHFTIVAPLDRNYAAGSVHAHTPIRLTVNDRGDDCGAGTGA